MEKNINKKETKEKEKKNTNLHKAKNAKNDEFYTQLTDIEKELKHYKDHFKDKVVFCNCDDPSWSNFWKYFILNFKYLGLKKVISTHFEKEKSSYKLEYDGVNEPIESKLKGNGDFRSPECIELLKEADIVVTNPPFSLFREYVAQLMEYNKKFLIIGSQNAITYKEIFPLLKDNRVWLGNNLVKEFKTQNGEIQKFGNICWYSNIDIKKRHEEIILYKEYKDNEKEYPQYDNYDAININKVSEIPKDYMEVMGVPITFLDKYNPSQFKIIGLSASWDETTEVKKIKTSSTNRHNPIINKKEIYRRIFIKRN